MGLELSRNGCILNKDAERRFCFCNVIFDLSDFLLNPPLCQNGNTAYLRLIQSEKRLHLNPELISPPFAPHLSYSQPFPAFLARMSSINGLALKLINIRSKIEEIRV
jgi:hypothetical protein